MTKCQKNKSWQDYIQLMMTNIKSKEIQEGVTTNSNPYVYYCDC